MKHARLKLFCILTAIILLITCLPFTAQAATTYKSPKRIKSGTYIDLNGDGKKEKVTFSAKKINDEQLSITLKIGKLQKKLLSDDDYLGGAWFTAGYFNINKKDKYTELVFTVREGYGASVEYFIVRYTGSRILVKKLNRTLSDGVIKTNGAGKLRFKTDALVLNADFNYYRYYKLTSGFKFKSAMPNFSTGLSEYWCNEIPTCWASSSFKMYKKPSTGSSKITVRADTKVTIVKTDRKHWVKLKTGDGRTGFVYVKSMSSNTFSPGGKRIGDVFNFFSVG